MKNGNKTAMEFYKKNKTKKSKTRNESDNNI